MRATPVHLERGKTSEGQRNEKGKSRKKSWHLAAEINRADNQPLNTWVIYLFASSSCAAVHSS